MPEIIKGGKYPSCNPEQHVIDEIDRLVTESIEHGYTCDYDAPFKETCETCGFEWHGKPNGIGCPGVYSTDEQRKVYTDQITGVRLGSANGGPVRQFLMVPDDGSPPYRFIGVCHVQHDRRDLNFTVQVLPLQGDSDESRAFVELLEARSDLEFQPWQRELLNAFASQRDSDDTVLGDTP